MGEIANVRKTSDVLVLAHRGYWGHYNNREANVPENSANAIYYANAACMDGMELDIKESRDGVLFLMHDWNLGRTTNVYGNNIGNKYDPMTNRGYNPGIFNFDAGEIEKLQLLTPDRSRVTNFRVPRVSGILHNWVEARMETPIVFDVKTTSGVRQLDTLVGAVVQGGINKMGVKVNATLYPSPAAFFNDAKHLQVIPVYTTNMLGLISVHSTLEAWKVATQTIEINVKQPNGLLSYQKQDIQHRGGRVGVFHAIPDSPIANSFYQNTGQCCYKLSDLYYSYVVNGQPAGRDTDDRRGNLAFLTSEGFGLITSDDPRGVVRHMAAAGKRQTHIRDY